MGGWGASGGVLLGRESLALVGRGMGIGLCSVGDGVGSYVGTLVCHNHHHGHHGFFIVQWGNLRRFVPRVSAAQKRSKQGCN
jgi:hypothetical protein